MIESTAVERGTKLATVCNVIGSRKRKIFVHIYQGETHKITPPDGGWSGGSRDYAMLLLPTSNGFTTEALAQAALFESNEVPKVELNISTAMATNGTFCGKPSTPRIDCTQAFYDKWLKE